MTVFRIEVMRRYGDLDPFGHINNVAYHDYLQEARVWVLVNVIGGQAEDIDQVVARQEIAFLRPLRLRPDPITVETWVSRVGGASYDFSYRILDETGYTCATAKTQVVFFDRPSESARRIPPQVRALLLEHLQESGDD
jgi:acyl-CoA thioester hydrolase